MKIIFLLSLVLTVFPLSASAVTDEGGFWLGTFAKKKLNSRFDYWMETQVRYNLTDGQTNQVLYRTGVLQNLENGQGLGYLYGFIQTGVAKEHRFTFQHTQKYFENTNYKISHRVRFEGRFVEDNENDSLRFRYLLRWDERNFKNWAGVVWNEIFTNLTEEEATQDQFLERNRFFVGFNHLLFKDSKMELGYLNQYTPRKSGDLSEHILVFYLSF